MRQGVDLLCRGRNKPRDSPHNNSRILISVFLNPLCNDITPAGPLNVVNLLCYLKSIIEIFNVQYFKTFTPL